MANKANVLGTINVLVVFDKQKWAKVKRVENTRDK